MGKDEDELYQFQAGSATAENKQKNFFVVVVPACGVRWQSFLLLSLFQHSRKNGTLPDAKLMEHFSPTSGKFGVEQRKAI